MKLNYLQYFLFSIPEFLLTMNNTLFALQILHFLVLYLFLQMSCGRKWLCGACRKPKPGQVEMCFLLLTFSNHKLVKNTDTKYTGLNLPFLNSHEALLSCVFNCPCTHSLLHSHWCIKREFVSPSTNL